MASLIGSVVGKEKEAGGEIFNCGTNKMCSYDDVCIAAAQALGKEALVTALPPDTKSSFPFRPNAEGFAVRVRKVMSTLGWEGAKHNVLRRPEGRLLRRGRTPRRLDQGDEQAFADVETGRGTSGVRPDKATKFLGVAAAASCLSSWASLSTAIWCPQNAAKTPPSLVLVRHRAAP